MAARLSARKHTKPNTSPQVSNLSPRQTPRREPTQEMDRQAQVTLTGPAGTVVHTTVPTPEQSDIYQACQAAPPPRIITENPA